MPPARGRYFKRGHCPDRRYVAAQKNIAGQIRLVSRLVAEAALGKSLPPGAVIHHVDENPLPNVGSNLVICENQGYHALLHQRARVLRLGGNPQTEKVCCICHLPKPLTDFWRATGKSHGRQSLCKPCRKRTRTGDPNAARRRRSALSWTPERRRDIARHAAQARWVLADTRTGSTRE